MTKKKGALRKLSVTSTNRAKNRKFTEAMMAQAIEWYCDRVVPARPIFNRYRDEQSYTLEEILQIIRPERVDPVQVANYLRYSFEEEYSSKTEFLLGTMCHSRDRYLLYVDETNRVWIAIAYHKKREGNFGPILREQTIIHLKGVPGQPYWQQTTRFKRTVDCRNRERVVDDTVETELVALPSVSFYTDDVTDIWETGYAPENDHESEIEVLDYQDDDADPSLFRHVNRRQRLDAPPGSSDVEWKEIRHQAAIEREGRGDVLIAKRRRTARKHKLLDGALYARSMEWDTDRAESNWMFELLFIEDLDDKERSILNIDHQELTNLFLPEWEYHLEMEREMTLQAAS